MHWTHSCSCNVCNPFIKCFLKWTWIPRFQYNSVWGYNLQHIICTSLKKVERSITWTINLKAHVVLVVVLVAYFFLHMQILLKCKTYFYPSRFIHARGKQKKVCYGWYCIVIYSPATGWPGKWGCIFLLNYHNNTIQLLWFLYCNQKLWHIFSF